MVGGRIYEKNFLAQVILAVEFTEPVEFLREPLADDFRTRLADVLPDLEERDGTTQQVSFSVQRQQAQFSQTSDTFKLWRLLSADRIGALEVCKDFVNYSVSSYIEWNGFFEPFFRTLQLIDERLNGDLAFRRLGLRYIDEFRMPRGKALDWSGIITPKLTGALRLADGDPLVRAMGMIETELGKYRLRMQYGMPNPDHPAPISERFFVLDTDVYTNERVLPAHVEDEARAMCDIATDYFERAIGDKLRRMMRPRAGT